MIDSPELENILKNATDISIVCEIYNADAVPGDDGFDPGDALGCFSAIAAENINFKGVTYTRLVRRFGNINRVISKEKNPVTVEFSNLSREIAQFQFAHDFEGLIMVIRLLSRSLSSSLTATQVLFTGRCEKPDGGKSESVRVTANYILNTLDITVPRRKFTKDDQEGRVPSDPEFEGFLFIPQYGTTSYSVRVKRGGLFGLFGVHKRIQKTLSYSSFSDLDSSRSVPEVLGRSQLEGVHVGYDDVGTFIRMVTAFCEGEIEDYQNIRSTDANLPLDATKTPHYGLVGTANGDGPGWVANGYYSRTAVWRLQANNTTVDNVDPAPQVVAVVIGRKMMTPDNSGDWITYAWNANASAHTRFLLTSGDYGKLAESWIDDEYFAESYWFNDENIFNTNVSDFIFVEAG
jgi:hypothetical protein